jgi:L-threonylcarbamoyladenylate synthase
MPPIMAPDCSQAVRALREHRVVAAATETFFGLLAVAEDPLALDSLSRIKPRRPDKGVALILPDVSEWSRWVTAIPNVAALLASRFWPGPLSIALPAAPWVDRRLTVGGSVAVRVPGASVALELAQATGCALTATSANAPGDPPATTAAEVRASLGMTIEACRVVVVESTAPGGLSSTLVAVEPSGVSVLRSGPISRSEIEKAASVNGPGRPR